MQSILGHVDPRILSRGECSSRLHPRLSASGRPGLGLSSGAVVDMPFVWVLVTIIQVILGSTVTRSPNATMAPSALTDLDLAVDFFERGAELSPRARQALVCPISIHPPARVMRQPTMFVH